MIFSECNAEGYSANDHVRRKRADNAGETFKMLKDAETRAATIEKDFATHGKDGLSFSAEDRGRARDAMNLLAPRR
jgi:hypothetical protein